MKPLISIVMGSQSDWKTMKSTAEVLDLLKIPFEVKVVSAHRTPDLLFKFSEMLEARGIQVVVAGAGGAAHLPGMVAAKTLVPVLGVPIETKALKGLDSLLSINQMPEGIPVATLAIGTAGAANAGLFAASLLALQNPAIKKRLLEFRNKQKKKVLASKLTRNQK